MRKSIGLFILAASLFFAGSASAACLLCVDHHPGYDPGIHPLGSCRGQLLRDCHEHERASSRPRPKDEAVAWLPRMNRETAAIDARRKVCDALHALYRARHTDHRPPADLKHVFGCRRWTEDFRYHYAGLIPKEPLRATTFVVGLVS